MELFYLKFKNFVKDNKIKIITLVMMVIAAVLLTLLWNSCFPPSLGIHSTTPDICNQKVLEPLLILSVLIGLILLVILIINYIKSKKEVK